MLALRYVALLTLVIWVGGLLALGGIAAPSTFEVLAARQVADSRMLAGALVGEMLRRFELAAYICGGVLLLTLIARRILGPRPHRFAWRAGIALVMLLASAYAGVVIAGRIEQLQHEMGVAPSSLPASDARRVEFGRLHGLSTALQIVPLVGGLLLMYWEIRE